MILEIKTNLYEALARVSPSSNNTKATILYYKSVFHSYLKEWKDALFSIDTCLS